MQFQGHRAQVHMKNGKIIGYSSSFHGSDQLAWGDQKIEISSQDAARIAQQKYKMEVYQKSPIKKRILQLKSGDLTLIYEVLLRNEENFLQISVDAYSGTLVLPR